MFTASYLQRSCCHPVKMEAVGSAGDAFDADVAAVACVRKVRATGPDIRVAAPVPEPAFTVLPVTSSVAVQPGIRAARLAGSASLGTSTSSSALSGQAMMRPLPARAASSAAPRAGGARTVASATAADAASAVITPERAWAARRLALLTSIDSCSAAIARKHDTALSSASRAAAPAAARKTPRQYSESSRDSSSAAYSPGPDMAMPVHVCARLRLEKFNFWFQLIYNFHVAYLAKRSMQFAIISSTKVSARAMLRLWLSGGPARAAHLAPRLPLPSLRGFAAEAGPKSGAGAAKPAAKKGGKQQASSKKVVLKAPFKQPDSVRYAVPLCDIPSQSPAEGARASSCSLLRSHKAGVPGLWACLCPFSPPRVFVINCPFSPLTLIHRAVNMGMVLSTGQSQQKCAWLRARRAQQSRRRRRRLLPLPLTMARTLTMRSCRCCMTY